MTRLIALFALVLGLAVASVAEAETPARTISVAAEGSVSIPPDLVTIRVGVEAVDEDASAAMDGASVAILAMLAQLDGAGVAPEDVRTGAVRLQPRYSSSSLSSGNQILGYVAVNTVTVDLRDLDRLGPLLQALIGDGANRLDDVRFGLQDPTDALDEARRRAVAEAMRRAALYADAAGVELGAVLSLSDTGGAGYQPLRAEMAMMDMAQSAPDFAIPTAPGDIEMSVSVSMVFAIAG